MYKKKWTNASLFVTFAWISFSAWLSPNPLRTASNVITNLRGADELRLKISMTDGLLLKQRTPSNVISFLTLVDLVNK